MKKLLLLFIITIGFVYNSNAQNQEVAIDAPSTSVKSVDSNQVFIAVEVEPTFPGGLKKFKNYVNENKQSGETTGRVIAQFIVERDGSISNIKILRSAADVLSTEATRLLTNSPKWTSGIQNGQQIRCYYTAVLDF